MAFRLSRPVGNAVAVLTFVSVFGGMFAAGVLALIGVHGLAATWFLAGTVWVIGLASAGLLAARAVVSPEQRLLGEMGDEENPWGEEEIEEFVETFGDE